MTSLTHIQDVLLVVAEAVLMAEVVGEVGHRHVHVALGHVQPLCRHVGGIDSIY